MQPAPLWCIWRRIPSFEPCVRHRSFEPWHLPAHAGGGAASDLPLRPRAGDGAQGSFKGVRITVGYALLLLVIGMVREWLSLGTVFGAPVGRWALLPLAKMPAGGFIVLGILCAIWRAAAAKRREFLKKGSAGYPDRALPEGGGPRTVKEVVSSSAVFFSYALLAIFAQNAVFTRALGVSRMVQLVGDDRTSSALFGMMLCITQVLVAPVAFLAGRIHRPAG